MDSSVNTQLQPLQGGGDGVLLAGLDGVGGVVRGGSGLNWAEQCQCWPASVANIFCKADSYMIHHYEDSGASVRAKIGSGWLISGQNRFWKLLRTARDVLHGSRDSLWPQGANWC